MKTSIFSVVAFYLVVTLTCGGCGKKETAAPPPPQLGAQGISQAEADKQIQIVQNNKGIPDSAKPGIIDGIRAKVK